MGPYVLRSVNAHFKLWDSGIQDSFDENIRQAPIGDVPVINATCTCQTHTGGACGTGQTGSCPLGQSAVTTTCHPQGCSNGSQTDGASSCQNDFARCCGAFVIRHCGQTTIGQPVPTDALGNPTDCNYGNVLQGHPCGSDQTTKCVPDTMTCPLPTCSGTLPPVDSSNIPVVAVCNNKLPPAPMAYNLVATCDQTQYCQYQCASPYVYVARNNDCEKPGAPPPPQGPTCSYYSGNSPFTGRWSGYYTDPSGLVDNNDINNSYGDLFMTMACDPSANLTTLCIFYTTNHIYASTSRGTYSPLGCGGTDSSAIVCNAWAGSSASAWNGTKTFYWQNNAKNSSNYSGSPGSFSITCNGNSQLTNIQVTNPDRSPNEPLLPTTGVTPAALNGCNWSGQLSLNDFGDGNDVIITCSQDSNGKGIITNFALYQPITTKP